VSAGRPLVEVEGLSKRFKIYRTPWDRALEWASAGRLRRHEDFWALRDISFGVPAGECFGVIGPNGSGKTTLLKVLSRVLRPTEGRFRVNAPAVYSLLELGTGFHPDLTGRENLFQSARLLGLPGVLLRPDLVEQIREFADIGDFFDRPLRFYSSGMHVRLGFSLFAFLQPDVMVVDEALSVGDIFFQQKCAARIEAMRETGTTFLFVSHDMEAVRKLCGQVLLLDSGRAAFLGPSSEAVNRYHSLVFHGRPPRGPVLHHREADPQAGMTAAEVERGNILKPDGRRHGDRGLEVVAARVTDGAGRDTTAVGMREELRFDLLIVAHEAVSSPSAGFVLFDRLGNCVFSAGTGNLGHRLPALRPGERVVVRLTVTFSVQPGRYTFNVGTAELGRVHDWHEMLGPIEVLHEGLGPPPFYGLAELPMVTRHGVVERLPESSGEPALSGPTVDQNWK
jgi:ABC-type polysaccharide/polyol phosphate transport system ATPase subunit